MKTILYLENITPAIEEQTTKPVFVVQFQPVKMTEEELRQLLNLLNEHKINVELK